jgi:hypothetical protein
MQFATQDLGLPISVVIFTQSTGNNHGETKLGKIEKKKNRSKTHGGAALKVQSAELLLCAAIEDWMLSRC